MCYALQNSAVRHENTFMLFSLSLLQTPAWLAALTHTQRTAAKNNNSVLQRQQCDDLALNVTSHISYFYACHAWKYLHSPERQKFFCQLCGLICLSQMSFHLVKTTQELPDLK